MDPGKVKSLLNFVNSLGVAHVVESIRELKDGHHFISLIKILDNDVPHCDQPVQRYRFILKYLEEFYHTSLKRQVDFSQLVNGYETKELTKVAMLLLCAAIQSEKVKVFVDAITTLDLSSQNDLKEVIQFVVAEGSEHKLRLDFADILHRKGALPVSPITECFLTTIQTGDIVAEDSSLRGVLSQIEPNSPMPRTRSASTYTDSPMSPVHTLMNSPYMVSKMNNRRLHDQLRAAEKKFATETSLRQDLEAEVVEKNKLITTKDGQLRDLAHQVKELNKLKDEVDEFQAVQEELKRSQRENTQLKKRLEEKAELKADKVHLEKQNEELVSETQQLKHMMRDHSSIRNRYEESRVRLRRSELNLGELHRENCRLTEELEGALRCQDELRQMMETSQKMSREKITLLEEQLLASSSPPEGESLGGIAEQRVAELEMELEKLRMTWASPDMHQELRSLHEETCQAKLALETNLMESQKESAGRMQRISALQAELAEEGEAKQRIMQERQQLENQLQQSVACVENLQVEGGRMKQELEQTAEKFRIAEEKWAQEKEVLEGQMRQAAVQNEDLTSQITQARKEFDEERRMCNAAEEKLKAEYQEVENQLQASQSMTGQLQEQLGQVSCDLEAERALMLAGKESWAQEKGELEGQLRDAVSQNEILKTQSDVFRESLDKESQEGKKVEAMLEEVKQHAEKQVQELHLMQAAYETLKVQSDKEKQQFGEEKTAWCAAEQKLTAENQDVESRLQASKSTIEELQEQIGQVTHDLEFERSRLGTSEESWEAERKEITMKLRDSVVQNENLKTQNDALKDHCEREKEESTRLLGKLEEQKEHTNSLVQELNLVQAACESLKEQGAKDNQQFGEEKNAWHAKEEKLNADRQEVEQQLQVAIQQLQEQIGRPTHDIEFERSRLGSSEESWEEEKKDFSVKLHESVTENENLKTQLEALKENFDKERQKMLTMQKELTEEKKQVENKFQGSVSQAEALQQQISFLKQCLESEKEKLSSTEEILTRSKATVKEELSQALANIKNLQDHIGAVEKEKCERILAATELKREKQDVERRLEEVTRNMATRIENLEAENKRMTEDLERGSEVLRIAEEKIREDRENETKLLSVSSQIDDVQRQNQQLKQQLDSKAKEWVVKEAELHQEKEGIQQELGRATEQIGLLEEKYASLKADLEQEDAGWSLRHQEAEARLRVVETKLRERDARLQELDRALQDKETHFQDVEAKLMEKETLSRDLETQLGDREATYQEVESKLRETQTRIQYLEQNLENKEDNWRLTEEKMRREADGSLQQSKAQVEELQRENASLKNIVQTVGENKKLYEEKMKLLEDKAEQGELQTCKARQRVAELEGQVDQLKLKYTEACKAQEEQQLAFSERVRQLEEESTAARSLQGVPVTPSNTTPPPPMLLPHPGLNVTRDMGHDHSVDSLDGLGISQGSMVEMEDDNGDLKMDDLLVGGDRAGSCASLHSVGSTHSVRSTRSRTRIEITLSGQRNVSRSSLRPGSQLADTSNLSGSNLGGSNFNGSNFDGSQFGGSFNSLGLDFPDNVARTLDELEASNFQFKASNRRETLDTHRTTGPSGFFLVGGGEEEPDHVDWDDRLAELQRRNTLCRPHLQTSYPVETQTRAPTEVSDKDLKDGLDTRRASMRLSKAGTDLDLPRPSSRKRRSGEYSNEEPLPKKALRSSSSCQVMPPPPAPTSKPGGALARRAASSSTLPGAQTRAASLAGSKTSSETARPVSRLSQSSHGSKTNLHSVTGSRTSLHTHGSRASQHMHASSRTSLNAHGSQASLNSTVHGSRASLNTHGSRTSLKTQTSKTSLTAQATRGSATSSRRGSPSGATSSRRGSPAGTHGTLRASSSSSLAKQTGRSTDSLAARSGSSGSTNTTKKPVLPEIEEFRDPRRESIAFNVGFSPRKSSRRRRSMRLSLARKTVARSSPRLGQTKKKEKTPTKTPSKMKSMARFFGK